MLKKSTKREILNRDLDNLLLKYFTYLNVCVCVCESLCDPWVWYHILLEAGLQVFVSPLLWVQRTGPAFP